MQNSKAKLLAMLFGSLIAGVVVGGVAVGALARHYTQQDRNASHYLNAIGDLRLYLAYLNENPHDLRCLFLAHTQATKEIIEIAAARGEVLPTDKGEVSRVLSMFPAVFPEGEYTECVRTLKAASNQQPKPTP